MNKNKENKKIKICYFGAYRRDLCRNTNYITGLRQNTVKVIECFDDNPNLIKNCYKLFIKHWEIRNKYDVMIVGYTRPLIVPFARLITRKPIIFNATTSIYEATIIARKRYSKHSFKHFFMRAWIWLKDWLSFKFADLVLIESNKQKEYLVKKFKIKPKKFARLFTGADDSIFYPDTKIKKSDKFIVLFRGKILPEAGVKHILEAAKILERKGVDFLILSAGDGCGGCRQKKIREQAKRLGLKNLELRLLKSKKEIGIKELRKKMLAAHISIGQIENHERLKRTIPYKAFESLALKLPYITGNAAGIKELLEDKKNCLMVNLADPEDLAKKILELKNNPELRKKIAENGYKLYKQKLTPRALGKELLDIIRTNFQKISL